MASPLAKHFGTCAVILCYVFFFDYVCCRLCWFLETINDLVNTLSYITFAWQQEMLPLQMHVSVIPRILAHHIGENSRLKCLCIIARA